MHLRNWCASGALSMLAERAEVTVATHDPAIGRAAESLMAADRFCVAVCRRFAGRRIQRRFREGLRLGTLVAGAARGGRTYQHKLTMRRPFLAGLEVALWRRITGRWEPARIESLIRTLDWCWPPRQSVRRFFDAIRPDAVLIPTLIHEDHLQADWFKAARRAGIPVIAAPASWDTLSSKGAFLAQPDICLVWGDLSAQHTFRYHGLASTITGPVHWDEYPEWWGPHWPKGPEVLVAGTTLNYWEDEREIVALLGRDGLERGYDVWYRPHPRQAWGWSCEDRMPPGVALDPAIARMVIEGRRGWDHDRDGLPRMLRRIRCVVAAFSTVVIEAALFGVPSVLVGFGRSRHGEHGILEHRQFEHMQTVVEWNGIHVAPTHQELLRAVRIIVKSAPDFDSSERLRQQAQSAALVDGHARERAVDAILSIAGAGRKNP